MTALIKQEMKEIQISIAVRVVGRKEKESLLLMDDLVEQSPHFRLGFFRLVFFVRFFPSNYPHPHAHPPNPTHARSQRNSTLPPIRSALTPIPIPRCRSDLCSRRAICALHSAAAAERLDRATAAGSFQIAGRRPPNDSTGPPPLADSRSRGAAERAIGDAVRFQPQV